MIPHRRRRPRAHALPLLAVLLLPLLVVLVPGAEADHVYSHRFVYEGRVLTADGYPAADRTVEFSSTDPALGEPCAGSPHQPVTDAWGDFRFCFHIHALDPGASITVRVGNATLERLTDTAFRRGIVTLVLDEEESAAASNATAANGTAVPEGWNETFLVGGKVWRRGSTTLEGVPVYGVAIVDAPVNVTLLLPDGRALPHQVSTDAYGDFETTIVLDEGVDPEQVRVRLESMGTTHTRRLDTFSHRLTVGFFLPPENVEPFRVSFPADSGGDDGPGTTAPRLHPAVLLALALGIAGMVAVARKRSREK